MAALLLFSCAMAADLYLVPNLTCGAGLRRSRSSLLPQACWACGYWIAYFDKRDAQTRVNRRASGPRSLEPTECANQTSGVASHLGSISLAHFFGSMSSIFSISFATSGC